MKKKIILGGTLLVIFLCILLIFQMFKFWNRFDEYIDKLSLVSYIEVSKEKTYMEITTNNLTGNDRYEFKRDVSDKNSIQKIVEILKNNYKTDEKAEYIVNEVTPKPYVLKCFNNKKELLIELIINSDNSLSIKDAKLIKKRKIDKDDYNKLLELFKNS